MKRILGLILLCTSACLAQMPMGGITSVSGASTFSVDSTGLSANVSATTVSGLSSIGSAGFYCATGFEVVTTTGSGSDTLPQINFIFTDNDTNTAETQNIASAATGTALAAGTVNGTYGTSMTGANPMCGYAKSGTAIQYSTSGCSGACGT